jgi:hypothetical protein
MDSCDNDDGISVEELNKSDVNNGVGERTFWMDANCYKIPDNTIISRRPSVLDSSSPSSAKSSIECSSKMSNISLRSPPVRIKGEI